MPNPFPAPVSAKDLLNMTPAVAARLADLLAALQKQGNAVSQQQALLLQQQDSQFSAATPIPVVGGYGEQTLPRGGSAVSIGQIVRIIDQKITPANFSDSDPADAIVVGISADTSQVTLMQGFARGPMLVNSPELGAQVFLAEAGRGTCDQLFFTTGTTQVVGKCAGVRPDPNGCVPVRNACVGMLTTADFPDGYVRMNHPNVGNGTGLTEITDSSDTQPTVVINNTGAGEGAQINSIGGIGADITSAADGQFAALIRNTAAGGGAVRPHIDIGNSTLRYSFVDDYLALGDWGSGDYYRFLPQNPATGVITFYWPDVSSGTAKIAALELAQTWTAVQTSSVAKNYCRSAPSIIGLFQTGVTWDAGLVRVDFAADATGLYAVFPVDLAAGTVWTALSVKSQRGSAGSGVIVTVRKRAANGATTAFTTVDGPDTFTNISVTTNTMTFDSPETVAADTVYEILVQAGTNGARLFDFTFITTSQPFA